MTGLDGHSHREGEGGRLDGVIQDPRQESGSRKSAYAEDQLKFYTDFDCTGAQYP